ncbi:TPA: protein BatD [Enterobacter hormaechei subsp. steigerwaltii]|nr:protein BatD [Enterobacter hormaechei subsp. steigerwaltii]
MKYIFLLLMVVLPCQATMTVTRELITPSHVVPGQPVRVAVTFWSDSWFNPPPEWPDFPVKNGALLTDAPPNQLLTRREGSTNWSGVRMERQLAAWDQGMLRLPAVELTLPAVGQAPVTVQLPVLEKAITWPKDVQQPDRFLPASRLVLSQKINTYRGSEDKTLRAGDVIERVVTLRAAGVVSSQLPPLLYAIPGTPTRRLTPENRLITTGRGEIEGVERVETLRYLPTDAGYVTLPPIKLRWWDTTHLQWQIAELPGSNYTIAPSRVAGAESVLKGTVSFSPGFVVFTVEGSLALLVLMVIFRRALLKSAQFVSRRWHQFWSPVPLPNQTPEYRKNI